MELIFKWKYFLFTIFFYTNSIKQCSVIDYYPSSNSEQNQNIFIDNVNSTTTSQVSSQSIVNSLSSSCYLTITPVYDLSNIKYYFIHSNNKTNFFHHYIHFKLIELNHLIDDVHYKINELKLHKSSYYKNLTNGYYIDARNDDDRSDNESPSHGIYYESVYFNNVNKTITRRLLLLHDVKEPTTTTTTSILHASTQPPAARYRNYDAYCKQKYNTDANYWNDYYFDTFNKSLGQLLYPSVNLPPAVVTTTTTTGNSDNKVSNKKLKNNNNGTDGADENSRGGDDDEKMIMFNYESEHVLSLNLNLKALYNYTLLNYAIVYDKQMGALYLNIQTDKQKLLRFKLSHYKRDFWYKTSDVVPFKTKLKSIKFDVVKYGTLANFSLSRCNTSENSNMMSYIHEYDCEIRQENYLLEKMKYREHNHDIENMFIEYLKNIDGFTEIETTRCIIKEYFGKIFTCDGRLVTPSEYAILKRRGLKFLGLALKIDNNRIVFESDRNGFISGNKDKVVLKETKYASSEPGVCHECTKFDLRVKVEASEAYNQYKQAIKTHKDSYEQFMILAIVLSSVIFVYLRTKKPRK